MVEKFNEVLALEGPEAVGIYNTGQLLLEEYYTLGKIARWSRYREPGRQHAPLHRDHLGVPDGELRRRRPARGVRPAHH
jgi:hypothetical protein